MTLPEGRKPSLLAICRLDELSPEDEILLEVLYCAAVGYMTQAGVGAHGVIFTIRKSRTLTLHNALRRRGQFCFLTSIADGDPGFQVVNAALRDPVDCIQDADRAPQGCRFPGILTEKYAGHEQLDPHAEVTGGLRFGDAEDCDTGAGELGDRERGLFPGVGPLRAGPIQKRI